MKMSGNRLRNGIVQVSLVSLALLVLAGCDAQGRTEARPAGGAALQPEGTRKMIQELQRLHLASLDNPRGYYYLNLRRAQMLRAQAVLRDDRTRFRMRRAYASELLNGGETEAAIDEVESLIGDLGGPETLVLVEGRALFDLLGIAYLRLGERQNCIVNHVAESCILPLQDAAIHRLPGGSRHAVDVYTRLLDRNNSDYRSRWLLNVAYMTLGLYPEGVPSAYLIPGLEADPKQGIPRFPNIAGALGLDLNDLAGGVAVDDFNNDGWIDLFIGNEESDQWLNAWQAGSDVSRPENRKHPSELYRNNGDGTFTEVAAGVGIDLDAFVKGAVWGDVNNDGLLDLYVSVMGNPNRLYLNRGPKFPFGWSFEEVGARAGVQEPAFSFPTWFFDYDNDGWEDLFVASYDVRRIDQIPGDVAREYLGLPVIGELSRLYRNNGDGTFTDATLEAGLNKVLFAMGSNFGDLDNDGYLDFYVGTGAPDLRTIVPNRMFHNLGGKRFEEITFEGGFGHLQKGHAIAFADFDGDGDQDVYSSIGGAFEGDVYRNVFFENPGFKPENAWVTLQLEGRRSNRSAIGARIRVAVTGPDGATRVIYATVTSGGIFGASSLQQEIGLGRATRIDELQITWPNRDRTVQRFSNLAVGRHYKVVEGVQEVEVLPRPVVPFRKEEHGAHQHAPAASLAP